MIHKILFPVSAVFCVVGLFNLNYFIRDAESAHTIILSGLFELAICYMVFLVSLLIPKLYSGSYPDLYISKIDAEGYSCAFVKERSFFRLVTVISIILSAIYLFICMWYNDFSFFGIEIAIFVFVVPVNILCLRAAFCKQQYARIYKMYSLYSEYAKKLSSECDGLILSQFSHALKIAKKYVNDPVIAERLDSDAFFENSFCKKFNIADVIEKEWQIPQQSELFRSPERADQFVTDMGDKCERNEIHFANINSFLQLMVNTVSNEYLLLTGHLRPNNISDEYWDIFLNETEDFRINALNDLVKNRRIHWEPDLETGIYYGYIDYGYEALWQLVKEQMFCIKQYYASKTTIDASLREHLKQYLSRQKI